MSLEEMLARRARLDYRMNKYQEAAAQAAKLYAECATEWNELGEKIAAAASQVTEEAKKPARKPGDVVINVPTAVLGVESKNDR